MSEIVDFSVTCLFFVVLAQGKVLNFVDEKWLKRMKYSNDEASR